MFVIIKINKELFMLTVTELDGAEINGVEFDRSNFDGVNLDGDKANLDGVDLDGVDLDGTERDSANLLALNVDVLESSNSRRGVKCVLGKIKDLKQKKRER